MTEKRFMIDDAGTLIDIETRNTFDYVSDVCDLLNELHIQNNGLKSSNMEYKDELGRMEKENKKLKQRIKELELLNDGLNYALQNIRKIDVEIDIGEIKND